MTGKWRIVPDGNGDVRWRAQERFVDIEFNKYREGHTLASDMLPQPPEQFSVRLSWKTLAQMLLSRDADQTRW